MPPVSMTDVQDLSDEQQTSTTSVICVGDRVEVHGLVTRADLNGKLCTTIHFHETAKRWQLDVDGSIERVLARACNLRRDRIEIIPREGDPFFVMRAMWHNPQSADESALHIIVDYVMVQQITQAFCGSIIVHLNGEPARELKTPPLLVLPSSQELWDADEFMIVLKAALHTIVDVKAAPVQWNAPECEFYNSMTTTITLAHTTLPVYIAFRTVENTGRFAMFHMMSGASPELIPGALMGRCSVICLPTEAIAFHKDNMVKLPTTLTLSQAVRKVVDIVQHGIEVPCPICLELPLASEPTIFMPCGDCKVALHLSCMQLLYDNKVTICPNCRSPLGEPDIR